MKSVARCVIAFGLVGMFILSSRTHTERDVVVAQTRKPVLVTRLYTGPDNQTNDDAVTLTPEQRNNYEIIGDW